MSSEQTPSLPEAAGEDLFNYAVDREDMKWLVETVFQSEQTAANTVEYELQLLKIISVGWSIAYYLEESPLKPQILRSFWEPVREFATTLSQSAELFTGQDFDYFELLKQRLDTYLQAMGQAPQGTEPVNVIGPAFAELCGNSEDAFASLVGAKMFGTALGRVQEYLTESAILPCRDGAAD